MGGAASGAAGAEPNLTYVDLVKRLTDLERLAVLPEVGEQCAQYSSYDRSSQYDAASGKYVGWAANADGIGFIRQEGEQQVLAEMEGPGCIWRIWSAAPKAGHVRIYLDGAAEPAVDLAFEEYFNRQNEPFTRPTLVYVSAKGQNCYVPIPYQKSCKIVADKDWGRYYHFTYSTFPKGTTVPTFRRNLSAEESAALDAVNETLQNCGRDPAGVRPGQAVTETSVTVPAGGSVKAAELKGPKAITAIRARLDLPASPADWQVLGELVLRITWDGEAEPAVWAPLGDFFGTAPGANQYRSLPMGLTDDLWWYSFWYMPFGKSASIELVNDGKEPRTVKFEITSAPLTRPVEGLGRFHAKWHRDAFLPEEPERRIDWTMLTTTGRGRYGGVMLHVWNPKGGWWGEGDEKFFVDGEKFPSTFGTGAEDYFGYAWGCPDLFSQAFHGQTISMKNRGHISLYRWHVVDNVPFQKSFVGCIEKYFQNARPTLYSCVVYWYLETGGTDPYGPVPLEQRLEMLEQPKPSEPAGPEPGARKPGRNGETPRPRSG